MCYCILHVFSKDLQSSLGFDAARKPSDTLTEKDITELVEVDIPKVQFICRLVFLCTMIYETFSQLL